MIDDVLAMLEVRASEALPGWVAERLIGRTPRARTRVLSVFPARAARIKAMGSYEDYTIAEDAVRSKPTPVVDDPALLERSEERRVGKECRVRRSAEELDEDYVATRV